MARPTGHDCGEECVLDRGCALYADCRVAVPPEVLITCYGPFLYAVTVRDGDRARTWWRFGWGRAAAVAAREVAARLP